MNQALPTIPVGQHRTIAVQRSLLEKNALVAERNRQLFLSHGLLVINMVSSPGAGKTALIERWLDDGRHRWRMGVIVADLATDNDARRLCKRHAPVLQITTGTLCHLEADMIAKSLEQFPLADLDVLVIENVGNLVCPAGYDLGEAVRVVVSAVTDGEDKPLKYPTMYRSAHVVLLNKCDLAAAAGFRRDLALEWLQQSAPQAQIMEVSARTGAGLSQWYDFLDEQIRVHRAA
jgi:hydrogenase nickel incorporation protein HypB